MIDVRRASALLSSIVVLATLAGAPVRRAEAGNTFTNIKGVPLVNSPGACIPT